MSGEQRVEIEQLDAALTRRDVVNLFAAFASLPDEATGADVAAEAKRVLTNTPQPSGGETDAGSR